ncbi:plasmid replication protein RepC [Ensifer aridi]|uniref:plasmid replication protein RepC n=1 Tax=Ensifer aridi TaxID=1708715 RepID=UPI000A11C813|nr:plasmid replication protein RepC [Ensifer aridi]
MGVPGEAACTASPNPSGWRKENEARAYFARLADAAHMGAHGRLEIWRVTKRALRALKLNSTQQIMLETLVFATSDCDWTFGNRPIVWYSNAELARRAGLSISISTVRAVLAALADRGLLTYHDSGNCRRDGRRQDGKIVYAYGIDLSVLEARHDEFNAMAEALEAEHRLMKECRRDVQKLRRSIPAHLQTALDKQLPGRWPTFQCRYRKIVSHLGRTSAAQLSSLYRARRALQALLGQVQEAMSRCACINNAVAKALEDGCLLQATTEVTLVNCGENQNHADGSAWDNASTDADVASERQAHENYAPRPTAVEPKSKQPSGTPIDLQTVLEACPEITTWAADDVRNWLELLQVAACIRPLLGISLSAWAEARAELGPLAAAVAVAIIVQKSATGEIREPGAYLRGMTGRHRAGLLHLDKSICALLANRRRSDRHPVPTRFQPPAERALRLI